MSGPFEAGERVLVIDQRDRTYLFRLEAGGTFHTHSGTLAHDDVIGSDEGTRFETSKGMVLVAYRPRFADFVLKMPRGRPGGVPEGPRADRDLRRHLLRARACWRPAPARGRSRSRCAAPSGPRAGSCPTSSATSIGSTAVANIEGFFGKMPDELDLRRGDLPRSPAPGERFDRAVLDMAEPWVPLEALARGAWSRAASSAPTCRRPSRCSSSCSALPGNGFQHIETFETLKRGWHVTERSVRPDHRMVGHTGFLTIARRLA